MYRSAILLLMLSMFGAGNMHAQCEPSAAVRAVLEQSRLDGVSGLTSAERDARRIAILEKGLAHYHHDYFLLMARMFVEPTPDARLHWAEALHNNYPDRRVYALVHATALVGRNTPQAIEMLQALEKSSEVPHAHLILAGIHYFYKFKDTEKLHADIEGFLKQCPAPLDSRTVQTIAISGTNEQMARTAAALRKRLLRESDPLLQGVWENLWRMEFKARPAAEHALIRGQIVRDLAGFQPPQGPNRLHLLMVRHTGYEILNNQPEMEKIDEQILRDYPDTDEAVRLIKDRWDKQHPSLVDEEKKDKKEKETYYRTRLAAADEWHRRWPSNPFILWVKVGSLMHLDDATPDQLATTAQELLAAQAKNPDTSYTRYFYFRAAEAFTKSKMHLDQVTQLVQDGYRIGIEAEEPYLRDDRITEGILAIYRDRVTYLTLERAEDLLKYYEATNRLEKVPEIDNQLKAVDASANLREWLLNLPARAAEIQGRKLDALFLYRAAMEAHTPQSGDPDLPADRLEVLWKALGGTPATFGLFDVKKTTQTVGAVWERPRNPMPAFTVAGLDGKTQKLTDWEGKTLLINVWATWCPPCREELPQVQQLYDKLKERKDVVLLSFNVDEDVTKIGPYLQRTNYTFPVFLGKDVMLAVEQGGIPQTWVVNSRGKLIWVLTGTASDWQKVVADKLEEVQKEGN